MVSIHSNYWPTDVSIKAGCSRHDLNKCVVKNRSIPNGWTDSNFDDSLWLLATTYSAAEAGWGRAPKWSLNKGCCTITSPLDHSDIGDIGCNTMISEKMYLAPKQAFVANFIEFIGTKWNEVTESCFVIP